MPALRLSEFALIAMYATAGITQPPSPSENGANTAEGDEVTELVRELRESRAQEPTADRTIRVYSTHYMIGVQRFDSLDQLLEYIKGFPPHDFSSTQLGECRARARMEELLTRKAEQDLAYLERVIESGRNYFYDVRVGAPSECPL